MLGSFLCCGASAPLPVRLGEQGSSEQGARRGLWGYFFAFLSVNRAKLMAPSMLRVRRLMPSLTGRSSMSGAKEWTWHTTDSALDRATADDEEVRELVRREAVGLEGLAQVVRDGACGFVAGRVDLGAHVLTLRT